MTFALCPPSTAEKCSKAVKPKRQTKFKPLLTPNKKTSRIKCKSFHSISFPVPVSCPLSFYVANQPPLHDNTLVSTRWLIWIGELLDLADHELESLADILVVAGAGLGVAAVELLSQSLALLDGDLTLVWTEITLVTNQDDGNPLDALFIL